MRYLRFVALALFLSACVPSPLLGRLAGHADGVHPRVWKAEELRERANEEHALAAARRRARTRARDRVVYPPSSSLGGGWAALRACESGGDYADKRNPTYRGAYQFDLSTWRGAGGSGDPADAPPSEQDYRARVLFEARGVEPWPVCGRHLG